jgi:uncharacterized protein YndB with AHSA1/START domain
VYRFFTDPKLMVRWKGLQALLDARPGGLYRVTMDDGNVVRGTFVELVPNSRIVFTWGFEGDEPIVAPGASTVEVTLLPDGDGTLLRLVHRDLSEAAKEPHSEGWDHYLARLAVAAIGGDPGPTTGP